MMSLNGFAAFVVFGLVATLVAAIIDRRFDREGRENIDLCHLRLLGGAHSGAELPKGGLKMGRERMRTVVYSTAVVLVVLLNLSGALVKEERAVKALEDQGYSQVEVTHHAYLFIPFRGGDKRDAARFTAKAVNPAGKEVTIYVFVGWPFKGATVRSL